jgi:nitrite reductase/ring-hydroxylating ferredoxin subunit
MATITPQNTRATPSDPGVNGLLRVSSLAELQEKSVVTATGRGHTIAVFWHNERAYAVDNRCPHMGFPLAQGICEDGVLTCYWHYARFDLDSGGAFDIWAGDLPTFPVVVRDGDVWVDLRSGQSVDERYAQEVPRLEKALDQGISLSQAKAVLAMLDLKPVDATKQIVATTAAYGLRRGSSRNPGGWGDGLTILTAMANLQSHLHEDDRALSLYHGTRRVSDDAMNRQERILLDPLPTTAIPDDRLKRWFREFIEVRDADGAERVLRTAIAAGWSPDQLLDMLAAAGTDHYYRDFSHVMDTLSKAAELLDIIGWDQAQDVLPALTSQWAQASREEERNAWLRPENLVALVEAAVPELDTAIDLAVRPTGGWHESLIEALLGEDPQGSIDGLLTALRNGLAVADAAQALAYAAVLRLTRFPTSNEFGDWDTALHHFTYCASLAQVAQRAPSIELARGLLHGAMVVYQARFLNMPAARLPSANALAALPSDPDELQAQLLQYCERQGGVDEAGAVTYRYLKLGHDPAPLIATLAQAVLREDPGFHDFQMLEEGVQLSQDLAADRHTEAAYQTLVAIARWQAAHAPTRRATTQTYTIARRLHRGEAVYADTEDGETEN